MKKNVLSKLLALLLALLLTFSTVPSGIVAQAGPGSSFIEVLAVDGSQISFNQDETEVEVVGNGKLVYDNGATVRMKLRCLAGIDPADLDPPSGNAENFNLISFDTTTGEAVVEMDLKLGINQVHFAWYYADITPECVEETLVFTLGDEDLTADSFVNVVYKKSASASKTLTYHKGDKFSAQQAEATAYLPADDAVYQYAWDVDWDTTVSATTVNLLKTHNVYDFSDVNERYYLLGTTQNMSCFNWVSSASAAGSETAASGFFIGSDSTTTIEVDRIDMLYQLYSAKTDKGDKATSVTYDSVNQLYTVTFTFTQVPETIYFYSVIDPSQVSLTTDSDNYVAGVEETVNIGLSKELPVELTYTIGTDAAVKGDNTVNYAAGTKTVKGEYNYGVDGQKLTLTKDITFSDFPDFTGFTYVTHNPEDAPVKRVGDTVYFRSKNVTINTTSPKSYTYHDSNLPSSLPIGINNNSHPNFNEGLVYCAAFATTPNLVIDATAPTVTSEDTGYNGTDNAAWQKFKNANQEVRFTVADYVSDVKSVKVDGTDAPQKDGYYYYTATANGSHTITVTDKAGNSKDYTFEVKAIDTTAPTLTAPATQTPGSPIEFTVSDTQSGVDYDSVTVSPAADFTAADGKITVSATQNTTYTVTVKDNAGNEATASYAVDSFDNLAPSASLNMADSTNILHKITEAINNLFGKTSSEVQLKLYVNDVYPAGYDTAHGTLADEAMYYKYTIVDEDVKNDGSVTVSEAKKNNIKSKLTSKEAGVVAFNPNNTTPTIDFEYGKYIIFVLAYDVSGNELFAWSDGVVLDDKEPLIEVSYKDTEGATQTVAADATVYANTASALTAVTYDQTAAGQFVSGIWSINVNVNGTDNPTDLGTSGKILKKADVEKKIQAALPTDDGNYDITITATDICGNPANFHFVYDLDNHPPVPADLTYADGSGNWSNSDLVTFTVSDVKSDGSEVPFNDTVTYTVKCGSDAASAEQTATGSGGVYTVDGSLIRDGNHTLTVNVKGMDENGNTFDEDLTALVKKDTVVPTITETNDYDNYITVGSQTIYGADLNVKYTFEDANENGYDPSGLQDAAAVMSLNGTAAPAETTTFAADTFKKEYTYTPTDGTFGDWFTAATAAEDETLYEVQLDANDNAANPAATAAYSYYVDALAPRVTNFTCTEPNLNASETQCTNQNVVYTFDVTDTNFYRDSVLGKVKVGYYYNGKFKELEIAGTELTKDDGQATLSYTSGGKVELTLHKDGLYELDSITVADRLQNAVTFDKEHIKDSADEKLLTEVIIDTHLQTVDSITFKNEDQASLKEKFRAITHGVFSQDNVIVTVVLSDKNDGESFVFKKSGKQQKADLKKDNIALYLNGTELTSGKTLTREIDDSGNATWTATFYIPVNSTGRLTLAYTDDATNTTGPNALNEANYAGKMKFEDEDVVTSFFLSENTPPAIDIVPGAANDDYQGIADGIKANTGSHIRPYVNGEEIWVNDDVIVPIDIQDLGTPTSGLYSVKITVNGVSYDGAIATGGSYGWTYDAAEEEYRYILPDKADETIDPTLDNSVWTFQVNTADCAIDADAAQYVIVVDAEDYATNTATRQTLTVHKDIETPYVTDFKFDPITDETESSDVTVIELTDSEKAKTYGATYGYYCKKDTKVTVTAKDENGDNTAVVGVKTIYFRAVDFGTGSSAELKVYEQEDAPTIAEDGTATATFTLPANFKGQVYAYAEDFVGNKYDTDLTTDDKFCFPVTFKTDAEYCVVPEKTILETAAKHKEETHITFSKLPATDYTDAKGQKLYQGNVPVKVTITDTYSGIRSFEAQIASLEGNTATYSVNLDNKGKKKGDVVDGWTVDKVDDNLVTQVSRTFIVSRDSNDIVVSASMEDRAGNTSSAKNTAFSIDKTNPIAVITFDNNDATEGKYFKANRTATITVTERNFTKDWMNFKVNGKRINLSWTAAKSGDATYKEGQVYTAKYTFDQDGDYILSFDGKDRAGRSATVTFKGTAPKDFTIDKTAPRVTVAYESNVQPMNGNYYRDRRTVIVTVVEHNFNKEEFKLWVRENPGRADGAAYRELDNPANWSDSGDTHTYRYTFDSVPGSRFNVDFELQDRAHNLAVFANGTTDYTPDEFYIDRTKPSITFDGLGNEESVRTKDFESSVTVTDTYFWHYDISIKGARTDVNNSYSSVVSTQTLDIARIIENFANDDKVKDDRYTITVLARDMAGNDESKEWTFTVNRHGSFFVLNQKAKELVDGVYCNDPAALEGIAIYEYNLSKIENPTLLMHIGNETFKLQSGTDYSLNSSEDDGFYVNTYTIQPSVFADDALYSLEINSEDAAGNKNKNTTEDAKMLNDETEGNPVLEFTFDTTAPEIDLSDLDQSKQNTWYSIRQNKKEVRFKPVDNVAGIDPSSVVIMIDGVALEPSDTITDKSGYYYIDDEGYYVFTLRGVNDNVSFAFKDLAGNEYEGLIFKKITVSSNVFVLWYNNTPLFIGSLVGIAALAFLIIFLLKRRKKDDEEEEEGDKSDDKPESDAADGE